MDRKLSLQDRLTETGRSLSLEQPDPDVVKESLDEMMVELNLIPDPQEAPEEAAFRLFSSMEMAEHLQYLTGVEGQKPRPEQFDSLNDLRSALLL